MPAPIDVIEGPSSLKIYHTGSPLIESPRPSFFYFALSGEESLGLDPFNQPVGFLKEEDMHVFSFDIPGHGNGLKAKDAMSHWAEQIHLNRNPIVKFIQECLVSIQFLIDKGYVDPLHMAVGGLSRGGFIAAHLAAQEPRIGVVLGFAPLTKLEMLEEFKGLESHPLIFSLSLFNLIDQLYDKKLRFYIGNRDTRVGTADCFQLINNLTNVAYDKGHRSPQIELIVTPSIGHKGHGTPMSSFHAGARWVKEKLG
jgi:hypothetical protein